MIETGAVAQRGIIPHLMLDDIQDRVLLTALCDVAPGRAQAAATQFGLPHAYEDFEELLDREKPDLVSIATPIGLHYEQGKLAIERGVHVHFNQTMTTTVAEADDKPTPVTAEHARHVIDIFESAYRAAQTGQTQDLRTSF